MKTFLLKLLCRSAIVTAIVAWVQARSFLKSISKFGRQSHWQVPKDRTERPPLPHLGVLATYAVLAVPVQFAFEWHPLRQLRQVWVGVRSIRPGLRFYYLFETSPEIRPSLSNPMKSKAARRAYGWKNTSYKTQGIFAGEAKTSNCMS